jgi:hypothetical protein
VEKNGGINLQSHFSGKFQFGKLGSKTSGAILRHQMTFFFLGGGGGGGGGLKLFHYR